MTPRPAALLLAILCLPTGIDAQQQPPTVAPGAVVRWPAPADGSTVRSCSLAERTWLPSEGDCFYGVDLSAEGRLLVRRELDRGTETSALIVGSYPYSVQRITLEDTSRVNLSEADAQRAARERQHIDRLFEIESEARFSLPLHPPLERMPRSGRFGARRIINDQPRSPHTGADYSADRGTPVMAASDGVVELAEEHFFGGNSIFLDHGGGLISMYLHLHEIFVEPGDRVTRGAVIGTVGATGRATGPHLHFGLRLHGARVDPALLLGAPDGLPTVSAAP